MKKLPLFLQIVSVLSFAASFLGPMSVLIIENGAPFDTKMFVMFVYISIWCQLVANGLRNQGS